MKRILFIGTENYSRCRFAEILFNHLALRFQLEWKAYSRGIDLNPKEKGPVSAMTLLLCKALYVELPKPIKYPESLTTSDILEADIIIAMNEEEHRDYLTHIYPQFASKIRYFKISKTQKPKEGLKALQRNIFQVIENLEKVMA
jgi:protein-tyrosine-phosphatase